MRIPTTRSLTWAFLHWQSQLGLSSLWGLCGSGEQSGWHGNPESLGRLEVDEQLNFRRLLHWQIRRLLTFENAAGVYAGLTVHIGDTGSSELSRRR